MSENVVKSDSNLKNEIRQNIIMRLLKGKQGTESAELPIRTSFLGQDISDYNIIDTHYQFIKDEILQELGRFLLSNKTANEKTELPIRSSFVDQDLSDYNIIDTHYQFIKEEIFQEISEQLTKDKLATDKDALSIHASYLHDLLSQDEMKLAIAQRLLAKGMNCKEVAETMQLTEEKIKSLNTK